MIDKLLLLLESYEDRGIKSREYYFLRDMEYNLKKERNISKAQLAWLEKILNRGLPHLVDRKSLVRIDSLIEANRISSSKKKILLNLRSQVYSGKVLTEKQKVLISQIEMHLVAIKNFKKDPESIKEMKSIIKLSKSRATSYWRLRPQQHQAISEICDWLEWNDLTSLVIEPTLDENSYKAMQRIFQRQLCILEKSPHPEGSMRVVKVGKEYLPAIVLGAPYISDDGKIMHPVLVNGTSRDTNKLFDPKNIKNI